MIKRLQQEAIVRISDGNLDQLLVIPIYFVEDSFVLSLLQSPCTSLSVYYIKIPFVNLWPLSHVLCISVYGRLESLYVFDLHRAERMSCKLLSLPVTHWGGRKEHQK